MMTEIDKSLSAKFSKTNHVITALVLVALDLLQALIIVSVKL